MDALLAADIKRLVNGRRLNTNCRKHMCFVILSAVRIVRREVLSFF